MFGGLTVEAAPAAAAAAAPAAAAGTGSSKQSVPLDDLFAGLTTSPKPNSNSFNLLGSPQPLQQQQQQQGGLPGLGVLGAALQQQQQQQDWLGGDLGVPGPKLQQPGLGPLQVRLLLALMLRVV
jgi:hypothetical protein